MPREIKKCQKGPLGKLIGETGMDHDTQKAMGDAFSKARFGRINLICMQWIVIPGKAGKINNISLGHRARICHKSLAYMEVFKIKWFGNHL